MDDDGQNVIRRWLAETGASTRQRTVLQLQITLFESGGPEVLPGSIVAVDDKEEFHAMKVKAEKNAATLTPVFCYGPFSDSEITFLAGAPIHNGLLKARDILPVARYNRETLVAFSTRRRRERIG